MEKYGIFLLITGTSRALRYVTGYVLGHSFSGVQGYVWNHRFYGSIYVRNSVLFVEPIVSNNQIRFPYYVPSARRTVRKKGSLNAYVYKIYSRKMKRRKKNKKVRVVFVFFWIFLDYSYFRALMLSHERHPTIYFPEINSSLRRAGSTRRLLHIPTIIMILGLRLGQKRLLVKPAVLFWWLIMNSSEMWEKDLSKRLCIQCFIM